VGRTESKVLEKRKVTLWPPGLLATDTVVKKKGQRAGGVLLGKHGTGEKWDSIRKRGISYERAQNGILP